MARVLACSYLILWRVANEVGVDACIVGFLLEIEHLLLRFHLQDYLRTSTIFPTLQCVLHFRAVQSVLQLSVRAHDCRNK